MEYPANLAPLGLTVLLCSNGMVSNEILLFGNNANSAASQRLLWSHSGPVSGISKLRRARGDRQEYDTL